jgi:pimeloyl-ACP methyl ester carboxylesterase
VPTAIPRIPLEGPADKLALPTDHTVPMSEERAVTDSTATPTVALVHGAFADNSGWNGVIAGLTAAGIRAQGISNPLRGIAHDAAYVASALGQIPGPVIAVGHSYGGAVLTNAGARPGNVVAMVYVAAFAPDEGETLGEIEEGSTDSVLNSALLPLQYPTGQGDETEVEFAIDPEQFHDAFAADVPPADSALMAATQRPVAARAFTERTSGPAWRSLPCWAVIPAGDKAAGSDVLRKMAQRAGMTITEVEGSHVAFVTKPQPVIDAILQAVESVGQGAQGAPANA